MQEIRKRQDDNWVRCNKCGHKLFRLVGYDPKELKIGGALHEAEKDSIIEIKCHSCKHINEIRL